MIKKSVYKIPEGKLVKIELETTDNKIKKIKITGDFFLYPEEIISKLEKSLEDRLLTGSQNLQLDSGWHLLIWVG